MGQCQAAVERAGEIGAGIGQGIGAARQRRQAEAVSQPPQNALRRGQKIVIGEPDPRQMPGLAFGVGDVAEPEQKRVGAAQAVFTLLAGGGRPGVAQDMDHVRGVSGLAHRALIKRQCPAEMRMFQPPERIGRETPAQNFIEPGKEGGGVQAILPACGQAPHIGPVNAEMSE